MNELSVLSIFAGLLQVGGLTRYALKVARKQTRPAKATWLIWAGLDVITLAGMFDKGVVNGLIVGATIGCLTVAVFSLRYGVAGWTKIDKVCFVGAIIAVLSWWVFNDAIFGIIISLTAMCIGTVPTLVSAWKRPSDEDKLAWVIFFISGLCAIAAISKLTLGDIAQPVVFFVIDASVLGVVLYRRAVAEREIS